MFKSGDVVLLNAQFTNKVGHNKRPGLVLFEKLGNVVALGITSNMKMGGISLTKEEGVVVDSIILTNYVLTVSRKRIIKKLFSVTMDTRKRVYSKLDLELQKLLS
jgi:hypothetical protein